MNQKPGILFLVPTPLGEDTLAGISPELLEELNEHTPDTALEGLLAPVLAGRDAGLMSEAGCPAVADPGSPLVLLAHRLGIEVRPLVGPSSILSRLWLPA